MLLENVWLSIARVSVRSAEFGLLAVVRSLCKWHPGDLPAVERELVLTEANEHFSTLLIFWHKALRYNNCL